MFNFIIFILGAVLMFYMALRSRAQRHKLCTKGQKVSARVAGLAQSRHGAAYVLEFETAGGSAPGCITPKPPKARALPRARPLPYIMTPTIWKRCMSRATRPCWGPRCCTPCWAWCCWC